MHAATKQYFMSIKCICIYIFWINFSKIDGLNEDHVSDLFTPTHPCPVPHRSAWTSICDESPTFTGLMDIFVLAYMF